MTVVTFLAQQAVALRGETWGWTPMQEWEGVYEIHPEGRVRRVAPAMGAQPGRELRTSPAGAGYQTVRLTRLPKRSRPYLHRLVLETFVGPCPPGMETDHIDRNKRNNCVSNLRWVTHKQNCGNR